MSAASRFAARIRGLFLRRRVERELDDELRFHLEMQTDAYIAAGMDPMEARYQALRAFGGMTATREAYHETFSFPGLESIAQDVRYALRNLRNQRGFTAVGVASLALGIGANTAIFSLIDALLIRELPVRDPGQLMQVTVPQGPKPAAVTFPYPVVRALAGHRDIFTGLAGFAAILFQPAPGDAEPVAGAWVTSDYYEVLGLAPVAGRLLGAGDDRPGAPAVAVITDQYWSRVFGRDPGIVGTRVRIGMAEVTIVGVSPSGFTGPQAGYAAEVTVNSSCLQQIPWYANYLRPNYRMLHVLARPRPGISSAQAKARLLAIWPGIVAGSVFEDLQHPPELTSAATGWTNLREQFGVPLLVLMAVVWVVLLIACANIANLQLARASARQRDLALRLAIGASRGRVIRQLLTESALLSICGAALGIGVAWIGTRVLLNLIASGPVGRISLDLAPHAHVLLFVTAISVLTTLLFGVAPAWRATREGPLSTLHEGALRSRRRSRLAPALVVFQVGLSLALLIGAGLFVGTLRNLRQFHAGFRHDGVLLADLPVIEPESLRSLTERIAALPGVAAVSLSNTTILAGGIITYGVEVTGRNIASEDVDFNRVGPRYFETLGTRVLEGREFAYGDNLAAAPVAIVNEAFERHFFPGGRAIGQYLTVESVPRPAEIVGVVEDTRSQSLREPAAPALFVPFFQRRETLSATLEVRGSGSLAQVESALRREIRPMVTGRAAIRPLTAQVEKTLVEERLVALLAGAFGGLALLLACIGLYGLLAYSVARRTHEIGIRMALGAARGRVLGSLIAEAARLLAWGMALGLPAAWLASQWVSSLLFGLSPTDPATILAAVLLLAASGLLAGFAPALRASHVDPAVALRYQ